MFSLILIKVQKQKKCQGALIFFNLSANTGPVPSLFLLHLNPIYNSVFSYTIYLGQYFTTHLSWFFICNLQYVGIMSVWIVFLLYAIVELETDSQNRRRFVCWAWLSWFQACSRSCYGWPTPLNCCILFSTRCPYSCHGHSMMQSRTKVLFLSTHFGATNCPLVCL